MLYDWAFAQQGYGVYVISERGDVIVLEYNEFLGRIAEGRVLGSDTALSRVFTRGQCVQVDSLRVYAMVISGEVRTDDLPRRVPGGVLASGDIAKALLAHLEEQIHPRRALSDPQAAILLRPAAAPATEISPEQILLRPVVSPPEETPPQEMLRAIQPFPDQPLPE